MSLCRPVIFGLAILLGLYRDNGKENGNYYNGLYRDYKVGLYTGSHECAGVPKSPGNWVPI